MAKYLVSIIVPVYNVEKYLDRAMDSIRRQTIGFDRLQVIFADDVSTDKSGEIIDRYAAQYPNVQAVHLAKNSGAAGIPRNEAMKRAQAEYLMFLDPDDFFQDDACGRLYEAIESRRVDLVAGGYQSVDENGTFLEVKQTGLEAGQWALPDRLDVMFSLRSSFWAKIYRRALIQENNVIFPEQIPGQDTVFYYHYCLCAKSVAFLSDVVYNYTIRSNSISQRNNVAFFTGISKCYQMSARLFEKYGQAAWVPEAIKGVVDFYFTKLLDCDMTDGDVTAVLKEFQWVVLAYRQYRLTFVSENSAILAYSVMAGDYDQALDVYRKLKGMRKYTLDLVEAKEWFAGQLASYQKELSDAQKANEELRGWSARLEGEKNAAAQQLQAKEQAISDGTRHAQQVEAELRAIMQQLEEEKQEILRQLQAKEQAAAGEISNAQKVEAELRGWVRQLEDGKAWLAQQLEQSNQQLEQTARQLDHTKQQQDHTKQQLEQTTRQLEQTKHQQENTTRQLNEKEQILSYYRLPLHKRIGRANPDIQK